MSVQAVTLACGLLRVYLEKCGKAGVESFWASVLTKFETHC